jgi:hypothetical protein
MTLGTRKTKAPTPTRSMGLIRFIMARVNHLYPSGVGFIMEKRVFSLVMKVKKLEEAPKMQSRKHPSEIRKQLHFTRPRGRDLR